MSETRGKYRNKCNAFSVGEDIIQLFFKIFGEKQMFIGIENKLF